MSLFAAVEPASMARLLAAGRYGDRSAEFDRFIAQTQAHYWDPADPRFLDFGTPFDLSAQTLLPEDLVPELGCAVADELDERQRIEFVNETARWWLSNILHGEQGAFSLAVSLAGCLEDPGAAEYAANQAREEARHVTAFARYVQARWGQPYPAAPPLVALLSDMVGTTSIAKKMIGMQIIVEGTAMGLFATLHHACRDPLLKRLTQFVMVDEAFHHRVGKMWAQHDGAQLTAQQQVEAEDWALRCFQVLVSSLGHPMQKQPLYERFGLSWQRVRDALRESIGEQGQREALGRTYRVFHALIRMLLDCGVITQRTRHFYAVWADLDTAGEAFEAQHEAMVREGADHLRALNDGAPA